MCLMREGKDDTQFQQMNLFKHNKRISSHFMSFALNCQTERLGYYKYCAWWVQKQLTDVHKTKECAHLWCSLCTSGKLIPQQNRDWKWSIGECRNVGTVQKVDAHTISKHAQENQTNIFELKNDGYSTIGSDRILLTELMAPKSTITSETYEVQNKLQRWIQSKRHGMLTKSVTLLHDKALPYPAASTNALLEQLAREISDHLPYAQTKHQAIIISSARERSGWLQNQWGANRTNNWLDTLVVFLFDMWLQKLVQQKPEFLWRLHKNFMQLCM